jgi:hypothetical protein
LAFASVRSGTYRVAAEAVIHRRPQGKGDEQASGHTSEIAPGRIRTSNHRLSLPALYPIELRGLAREIPGTALSRKDDAAPGFSATRAFLHAREPRTLLTAQDGTGPSRRLRIASGSFKSVVWLLCHRAACRAEGHLDAELLRERGACDQLREHSLVVVAVVPLQTHPLVQVAGKPLTV